MRPIEIKCHSFIFISATVPGIHVHTALKRVTKLIPVADPGEGPGLPLFLGQTEARLAEKVFFGDRPRLSKGLDDPLPPLISWSGFGTVSDV